MVMSVKRPTSGGQTHDQEAAVQRTFHLERNSFFYLSVLMIRTGCSALASFPGPLPASRCLHYTLQAMGSWERAWERG